ncbi:Lrp/AsnC family transcriptional regulator [Amphritea sp. 1_MG-2023]|uniref:Lrp/AsnC family transcriptional regulator n=1 Tax=Amphritea sp. 1_MG-2023 TaxID=3062670 RepID=UPI0026E2F068|nr:Lrp/AsnC family transcriptional regulator [Amphritea sp. 1_MG-2023]MDO6562966.1 Lrp/AsnC family transcriptional regulator [Amphritea sp. 1_MG-2023]
MSKEKKESTQAPINSIDLKILNRLQSDARVSNSALSEQVNLSETPCWRRWKKLEDEGYIDEYRAVLNRRKLGFGVVVFTQVSFTSHDVGLTNQFEQIISEFEWVQMCHCITGSVDYILQLVARDLDEFSQRITLIRRIPGVNAVQSHISVKEIKNTSNLPLS